MDSLELLRSVWDQQLVKKSGNRKNYVFLSFKGIDGRWQDLGYRYPHDDIELPDPSLGDIYFCPNLFRVCRRREEHARPSCWLYADLDHIRPNSSTVIAAGSNHRPTIAWESSPNRFQAMWLIDAHLKLKNHKELNKHLSYLIKADKGGWDTTQVLRVPGTTNHKYEYTPEVRLLWA